MSADSLVFWIFVAAWIVVAGLILLVQLPRIVREIGVILRHVFGLIDQSGLTGQAAKAEADIVRIGVALKQIDALRRRAKRAADRLRSAQPMPPSMALVVDRIEREVRLFLEATSR